MRLVDNYNYLPGCCWLCRGVAKPIIDTELDLDGINSPDDDNPSAINRFYICADCGIEIGRMVAPSRSLEISRPENFTWHATSLKNNPNEPKSQNNVSPLSPERSLV